MPAPKAPDIWLLGKAEKWYLKSFFSMFLGHSACLKFFQKIWKLIFEPCINTFQLKPLFRVFHDPRTTFYERNIFFPEIVIFQSPGPFYPRNCSAESSPTRWKNFGPSGGGVESWDVTLGPIIAENAMNNAMKHNDPTRQRGMLFLNAIVSNWNVKYLYIYIYTCICIYVYIHIHVYHIYIYMYICIYM